MLHELDASYRPTAFGSDGSGGIEREQNAWLGAQTVLHYAQSPPWLRPSCPTVSEAGIRNGQGRRGGRRR